MAETRIRLPSEAQKDFKRLLALKPSEQETLFVSLENEKPALLRGALLKRVEQALPETSKEDAGRIFDFLTALHSARTSFELSDAELATQICDSLSGEELPVEQRPTAEAILVRALQNKGLAVSAKANFVRTQHEKVFQAVRILTDIRPIFADDPATPMATVIIHDFQLSFLQDGKIKSVFVAMDDLDVKALRKALDRADAKAAALGGLLNTANLPLLKEE